MIWMAHIPQTSETRKHWDFLGKRAEEGPHTESRSVIGQCADGLFDFDLDCTVQRSARRALNGNHHRRRAGVLLHQCSCCVTGVQIESTVLQCQYCSMRSIRGESHLCSGWCKLSANSGRAAERWWSIIHSDAPPCWQWGSLWGRHTETNCWADWARTDTPPLRHYLLPLTAARSFPSELSEGPGSGFTPTVRDNSWPTQTQTHELVLLSLWGPQKPEPVRIRDLTLFGSVRHFYIDERFWLVEEMQMSQALHGFF